MTKLERLHARKDKLFSDLQQGNIKEDEFYCKLNQIEKEIDKETEEFIVEDDGIDDCREFENLAVHGIV